MDITRNDFTLEESQQYDHLLGRFKEAVRLCTLNPHEPREALVLARFINVEFQQNPIDRRFMAYMAITDRAASGRLFWQAMEMLMPFGMKWSDNVTINRAAYVLVSRWHRFSPYVSFGQYDALIDDMEQRLRQRCAARAALANST